MILTIKREHGLELSEEVYLKEFIKEGNNVKRCAFNFFKKNIGSTLPECEKYIKTLNNIKKVNASWIKTIVNSVKNTEDVEDNLYGSRYLFEKLSKKDYKTEEERVSIKTKFLSSKNEQLLLMRGSQSDPNTNRCGKFNLIEDTLYEDTLYLDFHIDKKHKYHFIIDNIERNQLEDLKKLDKLIKEKKAYFNISISGTDIYIQYDNSLLIEKATDLIPDRIMPIDLNPYELGIVIMDKNGLITEKIIDIEELIKNNNADKTDNEVNIICKFLVEMAYHYKCSVLPIEELTLENSKIKIFNEWNVNDFRIGLKKWCDFYGIKFKEVNAYYSSFMGIYKNPTKIDSIASAIELGFRSYIKTKDLVWKRINDFLSSHISINTLPNHWKKEVINVRRFADKTVVSFKELYSIFKSNSNKYYRVRVRFKDVEKYLLKNSFKSPKSLVYIYDVDKHRFE